MTATPANSLTPELIAYAKEIVAERGIPQSEMTPSLMGEILQEAIARMERAFSRYRENSQVQLTMAEAVYHKIRIA